MTTSATKAKLLWRCRRGMLELDLIFNRFLQNHFEEMTETQINRFETLLHCTDPELLNWLMGYETPDDKELLAIVEFIKMHS